jgi:hypothetical protein
MVMDTRKLVLPAMVFVGGALLGRMIGFKGLVRAGVAALTVANMSESTGLLTAAGKRETPRKALHKPARKRSVQRKSAPKKRTHANSASAQTH